MISARSSPKVTRKLPPPPNAALTAPRRDLLFLDTSLHKTKPSSAQPALKHSSAASEHAISTTNCLHNCNAYTPRSAQDPYARCCAKQKDSKLISSLRHRPPREPQQPWHLRQQYEIGGALPLQPLRAGNGISPCGRLPAEQARWV